MSSLPGLRRYAAIALTLAAPAAVVLATFNPDLALPFAVYSTDRSAALLGVVVSFAGLLTAAALLRGWWWARMVGLSQALAVLLLVGPPLALWPRNLFTPIGAAMTWALLLGACLLGSSQFEKYEGSTAPWLDWRRPGMAPVRYALIGNAAAIWVHGLFLMEAIWGGGCFSSPSLDASAATYWPAVALALLLLVGLTLLAMQKTVGLLLAGLASLISPLLLISALRSYMWPWAPSLAFVALPGIVAAWVAVAVWTKPMLRFLRGR